MFPVLGGLWTFPGKSLFRKYVSPVRRFFGKYFSHKVTFRRDISWNGAIMKLKCYSDAAEIDHFVAANTVGHLAAAVVVDAPLVVMERWPAVD